MATPHITIGLPIHNGGQFLDRALESLLNQTYPHIRLIISDNASTDATPEIARRWQEKDPRVEYIRQPRNLGALGNFEFVAAQAQTEYFMWAACDDLWEPEFAEALLDDLQAHPGSAVCMSAVKRICLGDDRIETNRFEGDNDPNRMTSVQMLGALLEGKKYHNWIYGLFRTDFLKKALANGFPRIIGTDRLWMCQVALATPFRYVDRELFIKHRLPGAFADRHPQDFYLAKSNRAIAKSVFVLANHLLRSKVIPWRSKLIIPPATVYFAWKNRKPILKAITPRFKLSGKQKSGTQELSHAE